MEARSRFDAITNKPLEVIQGIKASTLALFGLYLMSPFYVPDVTVHQSAYSNSVTFRILFTFLFFVLPAVPTFLGWFMAKFRTREWKARACFYMFIGVSTLTLLRVIAVGFFPPVWLFYFASGLTSAVLYLHWKVK